jgi:hypothetical protein
MSQMITGIWFENDDAGEFEVLEQSFVLAVGKSPASKTTDCANDP